MINSLLTTTLLCLSYGTPLREAEPVDEAMTATCLTEDYTTWTGYYREQVLSYDGTEVEIAGGTTASDNYSRVFLPSKVELRQTDSNGTLGLRSITYAEYRLAGGGNEQSFNALLKKSPLGGLYTIKPVSQALIVGSYGYAPRYNRDYRGEYSSVTNSRTLSGNYLPNYMGQASFTLTSVQHYNYIYLRPNNGFLADMNEPMVNFVKAVGQQYSQGFGKGRDAGYGQGYQDGVSYGMQAGADGANMTNVFALVTKAFEPVARFFEMRLFGFLPLYWVFLAPLFVALISLLLRMVKH